MARRLFCRAALALLLGLGLCGLAHAQTGMDPRYSGPPSAYAVAPPPYIPPESPAPPRPQSDGNAVPRDGGG